MIVINFFDWSGTRSSLTSYVEAVSGECEKHGIRMLGLFGPEQDRFNWAFIFEVTDPEQYHRLSRDTAIPIEVTHAIVHYFWPEKSFTRELPRYPPTHFFE